MASETIAREKMLLETLNAMGSQPKDQAFNTTIYRVMLTAKTGELNVTVDPIPARVRGEAFATSHGKRIRVGSLMKAACTPSSSDVLVVVYTHLESEVEAAITLAWTSARSMTASALMQAKALFNSAHGKPNIIRNASFEMDAQ